MNYRLAQGVVGGLQKEVDWLKLVLVLMTVAYWVMGYFDYRIDRQSFTIFSYIWYQITGWERFKWFGSLCHFFILLWWHYFLICFFTADYFHSKKRKKLHKMIDLFNKTNSRETLGVDVLYSWNLPTLKYRQDYDLQVLGEGPMARCLLQKFIEADLKLGTSILLIAPEGEKDLLEELTFIFRDRKTEDRQSFFYFSLNDLERSASYSPFHGDCENFLREYLKIDWLSKEGTILGQILRALYRIKKPFELGDILLLLEDKRAVMALNEITLNREYLWHFDSLKKYRLALSAKLKQLGKNLKLDKYPITSGFPFDFEDILSSKKHLFVELGSKRSSCMDFFLEHLRYEISRGKLLVYLIHPEKFGEKYPLEEYFTELPYGSHFRIFSKGFSPLYRPAKNWHTIFLPGISAEEKAKDKYMSFMKEIEKTEKNLPIEFGSTKSLVREMAIKTVAGFFYEYSGDFHHRIDFRWLYVSEKVLGKIEYEPYQKRFKPEDLLRLRDRIARVKPAAFQHSPGVHPIIEDLRPKGEF